MKTAVGCTTGATACCTGGQYRFSENLALAGHINNLLDQDFTSFQKRFTRNPDGSYTPAYADDYNNKDKGRNIWRV